MTHDKFCTSNDYAHDAAFCEGRGCDQCQCICYEIEQARADEREQAAQRVAALNTPVGLDIDKFIHYPSAVAAARGEQS